MQIAFSFDILFSGRRFRSRLNIFQGMDERKAYVTVPVVSEWQAYEHIFATLCVRKQNYHFQGGAVNLFINVCYDFGFIKNAKSFCQ